MSDITDRVPVKGVINSRSRVVPEAFGYAVETQIRANPGEPLTANEAVIAAWLELALKLHEAGYEVQERLAAFLEEQG